MKMDFQFNKIYRDMIIKFSMMFMLIFVSFTACKKNDVKSKKIEFEIKEENKQLIFEANTSSFSIAVKTNAKELAINCSENWCTAIFSPEAKKIQISVNDNLALEQREAKIMVQLAEKKETIVVQQFGIKPAIIIYNDTINTNYQPKDIKVDVYSNIELNLNIEDDWIKDSSEKLKSASINPIKYTYNFTISELKNDANQRTGLIIFTQTEGELCDTLAITQGLVDSKNYKPGTPDQFAKDKKLEIVSGLLTPSNMLQPGRVIENTFDGNFNTVYHSPWAGMPANTPITLEYNFNSETSDVLNYIVLHPTGSGSNGIIKTATVWAKTEDNQNYTKVANINAKRSNSPLIVKLDNPLMQPRSLKIIITDAYSHDKGKYYVSLTEIECFKSESITSIAGDAKFFTDLSFSELVSGFVVEDIYKIENAFIQNIAAYLLAGVYDKEFRVQAYEPYRPLDELSADLKINAYSQFENPTGMYFEAGQDVVVFVDEGAPDNLSLRVKDFGKSLENNQYVLQSGANVIKMKGKGCGYICYYDSNYETAAPIKVHIASGEVTGYFDINKHDEEYGKKLLDNAKSEVFDIVGKRTQLAYPVAALKENCYGKLHELISLYDEIITLQHQIMGLDKYDRVPKNHILGRVIWDGFMHADGYGAAFHNSTMSGVANPDNLRNSNWGVAHEFGHVNQVRPGMLWVGSTECTNNIYSVMTQYKYTPDVNRLEEMKGAGIFGNTYTGYFNSAFIHEHEWGLQVTEDVPYQIGTNGRWGGNLFIQLIPFWQVMLYYEIAGEGNTWHVPFVYADVFEKVRNTDESALSQGQLQINYTKNICDATQTDLSDFLIKTGYLRPVDKFFGDYSSKQKTITQEMVDEAIAYASQYSKPETDYIHYISMYSVNAYKNKLDVVGTFNTGVTGTTTKTIDASKWKNVTAFETYKNDELVKITMVYTGSADKTCTLVSYPEESTRIEAVAYDGTKTLVYGNR